MKKYIWLFGENLGNTANNNSFYFWDHIVSIQDDIDKFLILSKTKANIETYRKLPQNKRKHIIWKNSLSHYMILRNTDLCIVTLSYRDVLPDKALLSKKPHDFINKPIVYLQHGTTAMKKLGYTGTSYRNNLFTFVENNPHVIEQYINTQNFKEYQIYYSPYFPRYKELFFRNKTYLLNERYSKKILWFLTWREYLGENIETAILIRTIRKVLTNARLLSYLKKADAEIIICCHQLFKTSAIKALAGSVNALSNITFCEPSEIDVMDKIVECDVLITDYSSIGFDFSILGKPTVLFQPDLEAYMTKRDFYCSTEELMKCNETEAEGLVSAIVDERYEVNHFFKNRLPDTIDYDYVLAGKHIDEMYSYFAKKIRNKITFIGYNFYGVGGTVSATKALAEGFMEKGYMVELLSLKRHTDNTDMPNAINSKSLYVEGSKNMQERLKRKLFRGKTLFGHLVHDESCKYLIPYAGIALKHKLNRTKSKTVISTRESLHLFLLNAVSPYIINKLFFFHNTSETVDDNYPGIMNELKKVRLPNALFVTETVRQGYIDNCSYNNYEECRVVGNTIQSCLTKNVDDLEIVEEKTKYHGIILTRISKDRKVDVERIIDLGVYLKKTNTTSCVINVYGDGDYVKEFLNQIVENEIEHLIMYKGQTGFPVEAIRKHDFVLNLGAQSFGMIFLEAILNGRIPFSAHCEGADEILCDIPFCFIKDFEELVQKINMLPSISKDILIKYYDNIQQKYSRSVVTEKVLSAFEETMK